MKVLIADDHHVVRRGLKAILADEFDDLEIGESKDAPETLEAVRRKSWDVLLLDINLPGRNGLEVLQDLKSLKPKLPVVVVSAYPEKDYALRAFKLGASAYVTKGSAPDELIAAVRKVVAGGRFVTPWLAERMAEVFANDPAAASAAPHELLSNREFQVLQLIATGHTIKEVSAALSLSEKTIGTYRSRISHKMRLSTNVELTRYALKHHLVE
jgi:DNA-binding NarL/FixJ family response regulator